jgi:isopentenyl diphosphate isomerase/L-lactate dehydrogenase-like FMN-dependent dehydrogenase
MRLNSFNDESDDSDTILNCDQVRQLARQRLPRNIFDYLDGGAGREVSATRNVSDIDEIPLCPLVMRDVSDVDIGTTVLDVNWRVPIAISPTALHRLVHPRGEIESAAGIADTVNC